MLASRRAEAVPRGAHGHPLSEATDPANVGRYEVVGPTEDYAQAALHRAKQAHKAQYPDADLSAFLWRVERVTE